MHKKKTLRSGLAGSLVIILLASFVGAYGTYAYFTDTETSDANLFTAGTLDLALSGPSDTNAFIGHDNFAPGDTANGSLVLTNAGTISSNDGDGHTVNLDIGVALTQTDADGASTDLSSYITVTTLTYDGADLLAGVTDTNGNSRIDLADVAAAGFTGLDDPGAAGKTLQLGVEFDPSGGNDLQGDSVNAEFSFTLKQS